MTKRSAGFASEIAPELIPPPAATPPSEETKLAYSDVGGKPMAPS